MRILKYHIYSDDKPQELKLPSGSVIQSAIAQSGSVVLYALVPSNHNGPLWDATKRIMVVGTGWEFDSEGLEIRHVASVSIDSFVWHVLELLPQEGDIG